MPIAPKSRVSSNMGAVGDSTNVVSVSNRLNQVKLKSASVEAAGIGNRPSIRCSSINIYETDSTEDEQSITSRDDSQLTPTSTNRSFLSIFDGGGGSSTACGSPLKPSVSTSCLFTASASANEEQKKILGHDEGGKDSNSNTLICIPTRASLTHEWRRLKTPNKCRECNLLVYFNGRECSFCGFVAHKKCVAILVIKCSGQQVAAASKAAKSKGVRLMNQQLLSRNKSNKSFNVQKPIFGQPITIDSVQVLDFIRRLIYEIDTRGLTSRGIYRVSSIKSKVDKLCNYYDQNLSSLVDLSSFHPNIIANALKMYLRQLPEPLLTDQLYGGFIEVAKRYSAANIDRKPTNKPLISSPSSPLPQHKVASSTATAAATTTTTTTTKHHRPRKSLAAVHWQSTSCANHDPNYNPQLVADFRDMVDLLPPINRDLVAIIMRHLWRVAEMSDDNQMSAKNLSIIFGPTLLSANNKSLAIVDNIHQARVVELMIIWSNQIFPQYANYESKAVIELNRSAEGTPS